MDNNPSIEQLVNDPTFIQWATGESDKINTERWNRWIKKSERNRKIAIKAQNRITGIRFSSPKPPDIKHEWQIISDVISRKEKSISKHNVDSNKPDYFLALIFKVAAVILLGVMVGLALYVSQEHAKPIHQKEKVVVESIETEYGEKKTISLTEGSKIIMAANSKLTFKSNWLEKPVKRVKLSGEAYFSITPQKIKNQPKFVVETEDGSASVWGTRFTVNTSDKGTQVVLVEGEVRLNIAKVGNNEGPDITMEPGVMANFKKTRSEVVVTKVNPTVYTSWTTKELYFDNTPFSVLVDRIKRTYGLKVKVEDPKLLETKLSGTLDFISREGLLKAVSDIMKVKIEKTGNTLVIHQKKDTGK